MSVRAMSRTTTKIRAGHRILNSMSVLVRGLWRLRRIMPAVSHLHFLSLPRVPRGDGLDASLTDCSLPFELPLCFLPLSVSLCLQLCSRHLAAREPRPAEFLLHLNLIAGVVTNKSLRMSARYETRALAPVSNVTPLAGVGNCVTHLC